MTGGKILIGLFLLAGAFVAIAAGFKINHDACRTSGHSFEHCAGYPE